MGALTLPIWSTSAWTEKFDNGLCTHFLPLFGLKSSHLINFRCEWTVCTHSLIGGYITDYSVNNWKVKSFSGSFQVRYKKLAT